MLINVFIAVVFEVALAVCPSWGGCGRTGLHPFPACSFEEGDFLKVSEGCPDERCFSDGNISGFKEILALLLAFEVLCHGH